MRAGHRGAAVALGLVLWLLTGCGADSTGQLIPKTPLPTLDPGVCPAIAESVGMSHDEQRDASDWRSASMACTARSDLGFMVVTVWKGAGASHRYDRLASSTAAGTPLFPLPQPFPAESDWERTRAFASALPERWTLVLDDPPRRTHEPVAWLRNELLQQGQYTVLIHIGTQHFQRTAPQERRLEQWLDTLEVRLIELLQP